MHEAWAEERLRRYEIYRMLEWPKSIAAMQVILSRPRPCVLTPSRLQCWSQLPTPPSLPHLTRPSSQVLVRQKSGDVKATMLLRCLMESLELEREQQRNHHLEEMNMMRISLECRIEEFERQKARYERCTEEMERQIERNERHFSWGGALLGRGMM